MSSFKPKVAAGTTDSVAVSTELKTLRIKTGAVKRNVKDLLYSRKEVDKERVRLEKVKEEDPEKTNQQLQVISEAEMLVPICENRLRQTTQELEAFLGGLVSEAAIPEEDIAAANAAVAESKEVTANEAPAKAE